MSNTGKCVQRESGYFFFIAVLRTIATFLITNTHLGSIYPEKISFLAIGGLLGDVLFFAVSGFCLFNSVNCGFFRWYGKRILRIYPTVIFISLIDCLLGVSKIDSVIGFIRIFIYPTRFHFIASIMLLYIVFFFALKVPFFKNNLPLLMSILGAAWITVYIFAFDKSARLDTAEQPITKFLFFESMLFGAYVAKNREAFNKNRILYLLGSVLFLFTYLASKILIDRFAADNLQIIIVLSLLATCCFTVLAFASVEDVIAKCGFINKITGFIAPLTLQIYVVQHLIIAAIKDLKQIIFPFNLILVIALILLFAFLLNRSEKFLLKLLKKHEKR